MSADLGLANAGNFPNNLYVSSTNAASREPFNARLQGASAWVPATVDVNQWIQVDLKSPYIINGIVTQGGGAAVVGWLLTYKLAYSEDNKAFTTMPAAFNANVDATNTNVQTISPPITAQYIRILPATWSTTIALRFDLTYELFGKPWKVFEVSEESRAEMRKELRRFAPSIEDGTIKTKNILGVMGSRGAGKSSFINQSAESMLGGGPREIAAVGSQGTDSLTVNLTMYNIDPSVVSKAMDVRICDFPGFDVNQDFLKSYPDLPSILAGYWKNGTEISPKMSGHDPKFKDSYEPNPTIFNRVHCLILVIDSVYFQSTTACQDMYKLVYELARDKGVNSLVLLTKIDKLYGPGFSAKVQQDPSLVYKSNNVKELVSKVATKIGINQYNVIPIINATTLEDAARDLARDCMMLDVLKRALVICNDYYLKDGRYAEALALQVAKTSLKPSSNSNN